MTTGLITREPWASLVLSGQKRWERRSRSTAKCRTVHIIKSGTGRVYGSVQLVDVIGPLSPDELRKHAVLHRVPEETLAKLSYDKVYAWVFAEPKVFAEPIPYTHPSGAVIWVKLDEIAYQSSEATFFDWILSGNFARRQVLE